LVSHLYTLWRCLLMIFIHFSIELIFSYWIIRALYILRIPEMVFMSCVLHIFSQLVIFHNIFHIFLKFFNVSIFNASLFKLPWLYGRCYWQLNLYRFIKKFLLIITRILCNTFWTWLVYATVSHSSYLKSWLITGNHCLISHISPRKLGVFKREYSHSLCHDWLQGFVSERKN
jgi:hypothetical protein